MKKLLLLPLLLLSLTACKIDLTIIGLGKVKTDSARLIVKVGANQLVSFPKSPSSNYSRTGINWW